MDASARVQAHYMIEQVYKLGISDPFVAAEVEAFLKHNHQAVQTLSKQLILFRHNLCIVSTSYAEQAHINLTVALKREDAALQAEPEWEARKDLKQDATERPHIENEGNLCKVLHSHIGLISEAFGEEGVDLWGEVLGCRLHKLALVAQGAPFLI